MTYETDTESTSVQLWLHEQHFQQTENGNIDCCFAHNNTKVRSEIWNLKNILSY